MKTAALVALATLMLALPARADLPTFITLDRADDESRLGLQVSFHKPEGRADLGLRTELYGQFVFAGGGGGLYGHLPLSHRFVEDQDDATALQNLELGGFFLLGSRSRQSVLRLGISLPTAADDPEGFGANSLTRYDRLVDKVGIFSNSTWVRGSFSPLLVSGNLFVRADFGLDLRIDDSDGRLFGHLNGALGLLLGQVALSFELANVGNLAGGGDFGSRFDHSLAFGVHGTGSTQLRFGWILPLDNGPRGDLWVFSFGVQGRI